MGETPFSIYTVLPPSTLFSGILFLWFLLAYPLYKLCPEGFSWRNFLKLAAPAIVLACIYATGCFIAGEPVIRAFSLSDIIAHRHEFNVWMRPVILAAIPIYFVWGLLKIRRLSGSTNRMPAWMKTYCILLGLVFICYFSLMLTGTAFWFCLHTLSTITIMLFTLHHALSIYIPDTKAHRTASHDSSTGDKFECADCGKKVETSHPHNYAGPTKAAVNLIYTF